MRQFFKSVLNYVLNPFFDLVPVSSVSISNLISSYSFSYFISNQVVKGIVDGCKESDCQLLGGETAESFGLTLLTPTVLYVKTAMKLIDTVDVRVRFRFLCFPPFKSILMIFLFL